MCHADSTIDGKRDAKLDAITQFLFRSDPCFLSLELRGLIIRSYWLHILIPFTKP